MLTLSVLETCLQATVRGSRGLYHCPAAQRSQRRAERLLAALDGMAPYVVEEPEQKPEEVKIVELSAPQAVLAELAKLYEPISVTDLRMRLWPHTDGAIRQAVFVFRKQGKVRSWTEKGQKSNLVELVRAEDGALERESAVPTGEAILSVLTKVGQPMAVVDLAAALQRDYGEHAVRAALRRLRDAGKVRVFFPLGQRRGQLVEIGVAG